MIYLGPQNDVSLPVYLPVWLTICSEDRLWTKLFDRVIQGVIGEKRVKLYTVILFGILGSYLFFHIWESILSQLGKQVLKYMKSGK